MKIKMCDFTKACENTMKTVKNTVNKTKEITIHPKLDASIQIKNNQKELLGTKVYFNKEISLFKIIAFSVCFITGIAVFTAAVNALFCKCCDESSCNCSEADTGSK